MFVLCLVQVFAFQCVGGGSLSRFSLSSCLILLPTLFLTAVYTLLSLFSLITCTHPCMLFVSASLILVSPSNCRHVLDLEIQRPPSGVALEVVLAEPTGMVTSSSSSHNISTAAASSGRETPPLAGRHADMVRTY